MKVGELRAILDGLPDNMDVMMELSDPESDLVQATLRTADVESRCDEVDCLYLWGSHEEDVEEGLVDTDARKGDWMQAYPSGSAYWPLDPRPEEVHLEDVAHALSNICRFGGHCREFYSVAEHSVRACHFVQSKGASREVQALTLFHDSPEFACVDVPRPLKRHLGGYKRIERANACAIGERFRFGRKLAELPDIVRYADETMLLTEKRDLLKPPPRPWKEPQGVRRAPDLIPTEIVPLSPRAARDAFLARAAELGIR